MTKYKALLFGSIGTIVETSEIQRKSFNYMINIRISDIFYSKKDFGNDRKSMTIELVFQDNSRTLQDDDVNGQMSKIIGFLEKEFNDCGIDIYKINLFSKIHDTLAMARDLYPGKRNSLDALCSRLNVDNSSRDFHGALLDARILGDVYLAMTGGQTSFALQDNDEYKKINNKNISTEDLLVIEADEEELRQHQELCNKIDEMSDGSCIWKISKF